MRIDGKVVLITGASQGIGAACVEAFRERGARLSLTARSREKLEAVGGQDALITAGDLTQAQLRRLVVERTLERYGTVDILVNNAGVGLYTPSWRTSIDTARRLFEVNFFAALDLMQQVVPVMRERGGGMIVNVSSIMGLVGYSEVSAYNASKGGLVNLTRAMSLDLAPRGVRVNAVAPGAIATESVLAAIADSDDPQKTRRDYEDLHALRRLGEPREVAQAVYFLGSAEASFLTGAIVPVDGGMTASFMMAGRPV